jgi:hypothetical protein
LCFSFKPSHLASSASKSGGAGWVLANQSLKALILCQLQQTVRNLLAEGMGVEQVTRLTGLSVAQLEELSS